jgi:predicted RNase H-like HicB family nuclease
MHPTLEIEQETDGRWLAEVPQVAGAMASGATRAAAMAKAEALALHALAERLENGEAAPLIRCDERTAPKRLCPHAELLLEARVQRR